MLAANFLLLAAVLFCIGVYGVIARRNAVMVLMKNVGVVAISSVTSPITRDWLVRSPIAIALGVYPSCLTAFSTAARVFSEILAFGTSLITKETVVWDTPDRRATSPMVGRFLCIAMINPFTKSYYHRSRYKRCPLVPVWSG